jgi:hypothetical protein
LSLYFSFPGFLVLPTILSWMHEMKGDGYENERKVVGDDRAALWEVCISGFYLIPRETLFGQYGLLFYFLAFMNSHQ